VVKGLDLPALLTEPLRLAVNGNKDSNEVVNLIEAWKAIEDPWQIVDPQVEEFAIDLIKRSNFETLIIDNHFTVFQSFCLMLQELSLAAVSPMSAWSQLSQQDAQNIIRYMAEGKGGNIMVQELLMLLGHGYIVSPYQFLYLKERYKSLDKEWRGFFTMLGNNYLDYDVNFEKFNDWYKPSELFETIIKNPYSVTSLDRAQELRAEKIRLLLGEINLQGAAIDIGAALPLCLLQRCIDLGWQGPVISVDRTEINRKGYMKNLICFAEEFSHGRGKLTAEETNALYREMHGQVPQHQHSTVTLPEDLNGFLDWLDKKGQPLSLLQDQAFSELYLRRRERLLVRKAFLSRLAENGYAIFTRRFTALPYRLNDIIVGRKPDNSFFVRMTEERQEAIGDKKLADLINEGRYFDRCVQVYQADGRTAKLSKGLPVDQQNREAIEQLWLKILKKLNLSWPSTDVYIQHAYLGLMSRCGRNSILDLRRSIQGPWLLPVPFADLPQVNPAKKSIALMKDYERLLHPNIEFSPAQELTDKLHHRFQESMKKRGFSWFDSSSLIYPPDKDMYTLSLGRAEIEAKLIELITGRREGKSLRNLLHGEQERMAGFQICLRHRDAKEIEAEINDPILLSKHARLFAMYGYFLIQEKNKIAPFEIISPVWDFFIQVGLRPEKFWAVVHPNEQEIRQMLIANGIPENQIVNDASACTWQQGGGPNEALGGNLIGRNFELFYQLPDGQKLELLNVINIQQVEGEEPFDFDVWEAAFGWERLKMVLMAEATGRSVPIFELEEKRGLVESLNELVPAEIERREVLIWQLADAYSAAYLLANDISKLEHHHVEIWSDKDYREVAQEVLAKEKQMPRYRRIGQPLITEVQVLCRQLGLNREQMKKLYLGWTNNLVSDHLFRRLGNSQVTQEIFLLGAERLDKLLLDVFKNPNGPLYLALRNKNSQLLLEKNSDVYREEMRLRFGLPAILFEPMVKVCQQLVSGEINSTDGLKKSLNNNLGMESIPDDEIKHILVSVNQERLRSSKEGHKSPLAVPPQRVKIIGANQTPKQFNSQITNPAEGEPIEDMQKVFQQAAEKLALELPEIIQAIKQGEEIAILGIGNDNSQADATPHNMGSNVIKVLEIALKQTNTDGGRIHLLRNRSDMNDAGLALARSLKRRKLTRIKTLVVVDDSRAHLGSWTADYKRINENESHQGLKSVYEYLGRLPAIRVGTFISDQRGPSIDNILRRYSREHEAELVEALVLYAKRVLLSLG
jgi:peptidyl-tRNA hydrolase